MHWVWAQRRTLQSTHRHRPLPHLPQRQTAGLPASCSAPLSMVLNLCTVVQAPLAVNTANAQLLCSTFRALDNLPPLRFVNY